MYMHMYRNTAAASFGPAALFIPASIIGYLIPNNLVNGVSIVSADIVDAYVVLLEFVSYPCTTKLLIDTTIVLLALN